MNLIGPVATLTGAERILLAGLLDGGRATRPECFHPSWQKHFDRLLERKLATKDAGGDYHATPLGEASYRTAKKADARRNGKR
jgi:hypothetical protein